MSDRRTVHIVEDDAAVRRSLEELLGAADFSSVSYKSALGFLDAAPRLSAGCVLLDIRMPEMDGLELLAQSQQSRLSAADRRDDRARRCADRDAGGEGGRSGLYRKAV